MQLKLTDPQHKALLFIEQAIDRRGSAPTLREICEHLGYKAVGSAQDLVKSLRRKGCLETPDKQVARGLQLTDLARSVLKGQKIEQTNVLASLISVPCLGFVPAGDPLEAVEEQGDSILISTSAVQNSDKNRLFAVQAQGTSMLGAGILDGDWLVVHSQKEADKGDIVVARVEDDATVKRLAFEIGRGWYLQPENPSFKPIYGDIDPFQIIGRVVALQRSL